MVVLLDGERDERDEPGIEVTELLDTAFDPAQRVVVTVLPPVTLGDPDEPVGGGQVAGHDLDLGIDVPGQLSQRFHDVAEPKPSTLMTVTLARPERRNGGPVPFRERPVGRQSRLAEHLGIGRYRATEGLQVAAGQLPLVQPGAELGRIRSGRLACAQVQVAEPLGDVAEQAVGVVHELDRPLGAREGVFGEVDDEIGASAGEECVQLLEDHLDAADVAVGLPVRDVPAGNDGVLDHLAKVTGRIRRGAGHRELGLQDLVALGGVEEELDQLLSAQARQVCARVRP